MTINAIPPAFIFIAGGLLLPFLKVRRAKQIFQLLIPTIAFIDLLYMGQGTYWTYHFLGYELILGRVDKLSLCFGYVFVIIAFIGMIYALHVKEDGQHVAAFLYIGSTMGVVFAGDFFTLYAFWEIMAVASVFLIWYRKDRKALDAGFRYIMVHIFGGCCLLAGIIIHVADTGSIYFNLIDLTGPGSKLILLGFIINAAVPPFHAWLSDAYPEGTITGSVFLTAFTTKSAVYVLLRGFPGTEVLIWLGAIMAVYGVVFAVIENDIRRLLSYHIISQVGYMVAGVGIGTTLAMNGAAAHAFCHILYKALLFMSAGAVIYVTGRRKMTDLQGRNLYRQMPVTLILYLIGAFSISAVPLFSGFVSKTMVTAAAADTHRALVFLMLHLASIGTFFCLTLKLTNGTWFGKDTEGSGEEKIKGAREAPLNMLIAMGLAAFACVFIGVYPQVLYHILPYPVDYQPYTTHHVINAMQLLLFAAAAFWIYIDKLGGKRKITLDTDWFYRIPGRLFLSFCNKPLNKFRSDVQGLFSKDRAFVVSLSKNPFTIPSVLAESMKLKMTSAGNLERREEISVRLNKLKSVAYNEDRYRISIGWSVMGCIGFISVFAFIFFYL
ncbi:MAG: Na(+)/H(+) antiporter subunit D [Syntrophobacterales bacterium]|nr:Na(+)/H(+) antiporter subunit D [Syntrophobacterales bacterium]